MVEGGMKCVKYLLFAFNLLFFLFGLALIGVGIYVQVKLSTYFDFFDTGNVNATAILIIVVGVITLMVGFFGCCGAIKENHCMTMTFAVLIGIILICEIGGGIAAFVLKGKVEDLLRTGMKKTLGNYESDKGGVKIAWDNLQKQFTCCGVEGPADWKTKLPSSCCAETVKKCTELQAHTKGCLPELENFVKDNIGYVAGAAVGLGVVEMLGIIFACCLGRAIRRESSYA